MSEFSESYHLRTTDAQDVVRLLNKARVNGYVFPPENGWVAFVADTDSTFEPDLRLAAAAGGRILLHYVYCEDHGWSFALFEGGRQECAYHADWNDGLEIDGAELRLEYLTPLLASHEKATIDELRQVLYPTDLKSTWELEPGYRFAEALGLENYQWVDFEHVHREPLPEARKVFPVPAATPPPQPLWTPASTVPTATSAGGKAAPPIAADVAVGTPLIAKIISIWLVLCALVAASAMIIALGIWTPPQMPVSRAGHAAIAFLSIPLLATAIAIWKMRPWAIILFALALLVIGGRLAFEAFQSGKILEPVIGIAGILTGTVHVLSLLGARRKYATNRV